MFKAAEKHQESYLSLCKNNKGETCTETIIQIMWWPKLHNGDKTDNKEAPDGALHSSVAVLLSEWLLSTPVRIMNTYSGITVTKRRI